MKIFEFDKTLLENKFAEAESYLFDKENIHSIVYDNYDITTFDKGNGDLLKNVSNKFIIYCIWSGECKNSLEPKYIGHAKNTISRQRLRAHLTKKNKATGAQLDKVKEYLNRKCYFGVTYLIIDPSYMRTSLEEWLLNKNSKKLEWNKNR